MDDNFLRDVAHRLVEPLTDDDLLWLRNHWPARHLRELLLSPTAEVVRLATRCLGLVGLSADAQFLVALLGHSSDAVASEAEAGLWRLWFRAGSREGNAQLARAVTHIRDGQLAEAVDLLRALTASEPELAEAHHQLGLALSLLEDPQAEAALAAAVRLNPYHFAALAALGHACVHRGDLHGAVRFYRLALHVHPRLAEIREVVPQIEAAIERRVVA